MLPVLRRGERGPLLVMLHWLGGGAQTWTEVSDGLAARGVRCVAVNLPGFGEAAGTAGFSVHSMAEAVVETVRALRWHGPEEEPVPWFLAGHSMGGAVAAVVAHQAEHGLPGLEDLRGLVLVSPSPPGPEPMTGKKRGEMLAQLGERTGDPKEDRKLAANFIDENTGKLPLPEAVRERAIAGVLGMNRTAFRHWLERGSKEDWRHIGELSVPALVFAGAEDGALGPHTQRELTMPHLNHGELITLEGAGHLAPAERPGELIEYISQFLAGTGTPLSTPARAPERFFQGLLLSKRVSPKTREVMETRLAGAQDWNHQPTAFTLAEFRTLRALAGRIVPDAGFDLAARVDRQLAEAKGDGWRFAVLPPDVEAWHLGLHSLDLAAQRAHGVSFIALVPDQQDELLQQATAGRLGRGVLGALHLGPLHLGDATDAYTALQMKQWFGDVRAEFTRFYVGDPRTMDRIGYTGFADDLGFTQIRLGQAEEFER